MILAILAHTPAWVFVLFAALVALGVRLMRTSRLSLLRVAILPIAMGGLALFSLAQAFGLGSSAVAAWIALVVAFVVAGRLVAPRHDVQYSSDTRSFVVPGSVFPLLLMMTIFFTRYAVAVALAIHPDLRAVAGIGAAVGGVYGLTSGAFVLRALRIVRTMKRAPSGAGIAAQATA